MCGFAVHVKNSIVMGIVKVRVRSFEQWNKQWGPRSDCKTQLGVCACLYVIS